MCIRDRIYRGIVLVWYNAVIICKEDFPLDENKDKTLSGGNDESSPIVRPLLFLLLAAGWLHATGAGQTPPDAACCGSYPALRSKAASTTEYDSRPFIKSNLAGRSFCLGVMPIPCPHFKITIVKRTNGDATAITDKSI